MTTKTTKSIQHQNKGQEKSRSAYSGRIDISDSLRAMAEQTEKNIQIAPALARKRFLGILKTSV